MMQRTRYLIAPNSTYDRLTGYKPGEACSRRDLVLDLIRSLDKRGIKLMLYWTGDGPRQDPQAAKGLGGWNGKITDVYAQNWADVAAEYSKRYGDKVHGWWVDGCYGHIGYNDERWGILSRGLKSGNPKAIVALNNPSMTRANSGTDHEDFTTGEVDSLSDIPDSRWRDGKQFHLLSFLGSYWGNPGVRYKPDFLIDFVGSVNDAGGVITLDVAQYRDGSLDKEQVAALKAMNEGLKKRITEKDLWKSRAPVPAGNLACWKPARLLSVDGKNSLPANGGGGYVHLAKHGVDGDPETDAQASGQYAWAYEVDLIEPATVSSASVTFGKAFATHFHVECSTDRKAWTQAAEVTGHAGGKWQGKFKPAKARYVRIRALKPDGPGQPGGQMSVAELDIR
jgi:hypothetical protein